MDYTTSYVFCLVCFGLFAVALTALALADRAVVGTRWLAASVALDFTKCALQGLNGHLPRWVTVYVANELQVLCVLAMFLGLRWFVDRRVFRNWRALALLAVGMSIYAAMFFAHMRQWSFAFLGVLVQCLLAASIWVMLRRGRESFRAPALLTAALLTVHMVALGLRMVLSVTRYKELTAGQPWADPLWMASMVVIMLVCYCLLMLYAVFSILEMHANVEQAAGLDALTGAMNRRSLQKHAARELVRSERLKQPLAVVGIDLDHFKRLNDTYGHAGGDAALCAFVDLAREQLGSVDVIARTGGEEFVLLLPGRDVAGAARAADALRSSLEQMRVHYEGRMMMATTSMGVTERREGDSLATMLKRADELLYQAKEQGRNCVVADEPVINVLAKPVLVERMIPLTGDRTA